MTKSTLYLEDRVHIAVGLKATKTQKPNTRSVNHALKANLQEDMEDIKSWHERKDEETYGYKKFVELLKNYCVQ